MSDFEELFWFLSPLILLPLSVLVALWSIIYGFVQPIFHLVKE